MHQSRGNYTRVEIEPGVLYFPKINHSDRKNYYFQNERKKSPFKVLNTLQNTEMKKKTPLAPIIRD